MDKILLNATWTDDCQGKKNYDGEILSISTRYWPAGGSAHVFDTARPDRGFQPQSVYTPDIKPSAKSTLLLTVKGHPLGGIELASQDFEGETFEDVKQQVEAWAQEQMSRAADLLLREFRR